MTAEQALIEENKKDPRVRYITSDYNNNIEFWSEKPWNSNLPNYWDGNPETLISSTNGFLSDFAQKQYKNCILCIDDILPKEEDVKLLIEPSINIFSEFLTPQTVRFLSENGIPVYDALKNHLNLSVEVIQNMISNNEIQLRSFFIHLGSYVYKLKKEESIDKVINPTLFGRNTYIKTGRIEVNDDSFESRFENHPMTKFLESEREESQKEQEGIRTEKVLYPRRLWIEDRINAINQSVKSYLDNDYCIPTDWIEERNELIEQLNNLQDGKRKKM